MGFCVRFGPAVAALFYFAGQAAVSAATGRPVGFVSLWSGVVLTGILFAGDFLIRRRVEREDQPLPPRDVRLIMPFQGREVPVECVYDGVEYQRMYRWTSAYPIDVGPDIDGLYMEGMCPPHTVIRIKLAGHPDAQSLG